MHIWCVTTLVRWMGDVGRLWCIHDSGCSFDFSGHTRATIDSGDEQNHEPPCLTSSRCHPTILAKHCCGSNWILPNIFCVFLSTLSTYSNLKRFVQIAWEKVKRGLRISWEWASQAIGCPMASWFARISWLSKSGSHSPIARCAALSLEHFTEKIEMFAWNFHPL